MRRLLKAALVLVVCVGASGAQAARDSQTRARELASRFDKDKHKVKERRGVRVEVFVEMRGEPAARKAPSDYAGTYESEPGFAVTLRVGADGRAEGEGSEPSPAGPRTFTLRDARVEGALLAGTKVYDDGSTERLEGVFLDLNVRTAPGDRGTTLFGLGLVFDPPKSGAGGFQMEKLFYERKR